MFAALQNNVFAFHFVSGWEDEFCGLLELVVVVMMQGKKFVPNYKMTSALLLDNKGYTAIDGTM